MSPTRLHTSQADGAEGEVFSAHSTTIPRQEKTDTPGGSIRLRSQNAALGVRGPLPRCMWRSACFYARHARSLSVRTVRRAGKGRQRTRSGGRRASDEALTMAT